MLANIFKPIFVIEEIIKAIIIIMKTKLTIIIYL